MTRRVLITGTSAGLGKSLAEYYLDQGDIVFGCSRNRALLNNANYHHRRLDLKNENEVIDWVKDLSMQFEGIDVLINNAAVAKMNAILMSPQSQNQNIFDTNIVAVMTLCREVVKVMLKSGGGRIVNLTSVASHLDLAGEAAYAASKAALESFTRIAAKEFADIGVTVNSLTLPFLNLGMTEKLKKSYGEKFLQFQTIKKTCEIQDVTHTIDFFIDDQSRYITGQNIVICG